MWDFIGLPLDPRNRNLSDDLSQFPDREQWIYILKMLFRSNNKDATWINSLFIHQLQCLSKSLLGNYSSGKKKKIKISVIRLIVFD